MLTQPSSPELAESLAPLYGKRAGALVASGQAAIQLALELGRIGDGDEVVVPSESCHLVPAAVVRSGARPVFAASGPRQVLEPAAVAAALSPQVRAVLAVHHLGLPCDVAALRLTLGREVLVIEDAAQAFDLRARGCRIGTSADYVVTSFGPGKPLSFGGGGGLFGNDSRLSRVLQRSSPTARVSTLLPLAYPMHEVPASAIEPAIRHARQLVEQRRRLVRNVSPLLRGLGFRIWSPDDGDLPSWHRLPIWAITSHAVELTNRGLSLGVLQEPHRPINRDLPMFARRARSAGPAHDDPPLLLRVDRPEHVSDWLQQAVPG